MPTIYKKDAATSLYAELLAYLQRVICPVDNHARLALFLYGRCRTLFRMKIIMVIFLIQICLVSCYSSDKKGRNKMTTDDKDVFQKEIDSKVADTLAWIYLKDTLKVNGKTIVVLRPDSLRFDSYLKSGKEWIYEVDSDFAFGVTQALDSFENNKITKTITDKRFIKIQDCKECPILVDRDTIEYGIILTSPTRNIQINDNIAGKEYYLELFQNYFF